MGSEDTRPGLRERKRLETADRIAAAGLELFRRHGFDETTVDDIAAAAEISRATVFRYFGSKDDIVYSVEPELLEVIRELIRQEPHLAVDEAVIRYAMHVDENVPELRDRAALIAATPRLIERFAHVRTQWELALARELASRRSPDASATFEERIAASIAMSALFNAFLYWATSPEASLAALVRRGIAAVPGAFYDPGSSHASPDAHDR